MSEHLTVSWRTSLTTDQTVPDYQDRGDFHPTSVEWMRERSWHPDLGYRDRTKIGLSCYPEPGFHLITDYDDVPDWVPRPPDGWDSAIRTHVAVTA